MIERWKIILVLLLFLQRDVAAQRYNNMWVMGYHAGMDFNTGMPVYAGDSCDTWESSASLCDASGNLLFYAYADKVRDRTHQLMPNGTGLKGSISTTQGAAIAQVKGSDSLYYLFTLANEDMTPHALRYSMLDLRSHGGLGDVDPVRKNLVLATDQSEKMILAGSCGNLWLLTHHMDSPIFYAFDLTKVGISAPVISRVGSYKVPTGFMIGEMKVSRDFSTLALVNFSWSDNGSVELYDFDQASGLVSNCRPIDTFPLALHFGWGYPYGIEFSPAGSKLYLGGGLDGKLYQYDLTAGSTAAIRSSRYTLDSNAGTYGLRRSPDHMIYMGNRRYPQDTVSRIRTPEAAGAACNLERVHGSWRPPPSLDLGYNMGSSYLPQTNKDGDTLYNKMNRSLCKGWYATLTAPGYDHERYTWNDGDTAYIKKVYTPGTYWVRSKAHCRTLVDTFVVTEQATDTLHALVLDTLLCADSAMLLKVPLSYTAFTWSDGDTVSVSKKAMSGSTSTLSGRTAEACRVHIDTFRLREKRPADTYYTADTSICPEKMITLAPLRPGFFSRKWYDGSTGSSKTIVAKGGKYWAISSLPGCKRAIDTFRLTETPDSVFRSKTFLVFCEWTTALLEGRKGMDKYLWSTGDTTRNLSVRPGRSVLLSATEYCSLYLDSFTVAERPATVIPIHTDTVICFRDSITLRVPPGYDEYAWDDVHKVKDTTLFAPASLLLSARNNAACLALQHSYVIDMVRFSSHLPDTFICNEGQTVLDARIDDTAARYRWHTGSTAPALTVSDTGMQVVHISVRNCTLTDTAVVSRTLIPLDLGPDTLLCNGQSLLLGPGHMPGNTYLWSTGDTGSQIPVSGGGVFSLRIRSGGCTAYDEIDVRLVNCERCVAFANAFTPNNDGINDFFKPLLNCTAATYDFVVFNRWGEEVFHTINPGDKWDGQHKGLPASSNVYFYMLRITYEGKGGQPELYKGEVSLVR